MSPLGFQLGKRLLLLGLWLALLTPTEGVAAFGLTTTSAAYTIETGSTPNLVFKIRRTEGGSTTSIGDIMSLVYNGVEYQDSARGSQINSGFDFLYTGVSAVSVDAVAVGTDFIKVTVVAGDLTHYYIARKGYPQIYMATYFASEPSTLGLCRYIVRIPSSVLPNGPAPSDIRNNTGAIESGDIFGMADGTTRSKHYSNMRLKDWSYIGATGTNVGVWMVRSNHEGDSGGPFYRSLLNQCGDDQEITYIINYGEAQTEPFRTGILNGPYTLAFTNGGPPPVLDTSWIGGLGLTGYVAPAGRGSVTGSAILNRDTRYEYTVGFSNPTAQYWTQAAANNGAFTMSGMIPGTYTMRIYKNELAVYTDSVAATAGGTTALPAITIPSDPNTGDPSSVIPLWRIGNWDGSPAEFLNADKVTTMHPSDVRMSNWNPGPYLVGTSTPATGIPCYQWKDVNPNQVVQFNLTDAQRVAGTIKIGLTTAYEGARPKITVNGYTSANPTPSDQPSTRTLTIGSYRGNNTTYTFAVPASAFVTGTNTLTIFPISGSGASGFLSAGYSLDCIEMDQGTAQTAAVPGAPATVTATAGNGQATLNWTAAPGAASYSISRASVSGGSYMEVANGVAATNFTDTGLRNGAAYYYVVNSANTSGQGINSAEASATPTGPALRAHLRFDENSGTNAADSTGNGWNGTLANGATWTAGRINNALSLDGADGHVTLPSGLLVGLGDFTVSAWVKLNTVDAWARVFDFGTGTNAYMFLTPKNGITNSVRFAITTNGPGGEQQIDGTAALPSGAWTHVAMVLSGSTGTLYVNGVAVGTNAAMTSAPYVLGNTTQNYIGRSQYAADPYLNGMVDEFRIHGRALSAAEISALAAPPAAPAGLNATAGNAQVVLGWNATAGATSYNVKRSITSGGGYATVASSIAGTAYTDPTALNGTTYYYVVAAVNTGSEGPDSAQATARPTAPISAQELRAPGFSLSGGNAVATMPSSVIGHSYQLQYRDDLMAGDWLPFGSMQNGNGGILQMTAPVAPSVPRRFYRILIQL